MYNSSPPVHLSMIIILMILMAKIVHVFWVRMKMLFISSGASDHESLASLYELRVMCYVLWVRYYVRYRLLFWLVEPNLAWVTHVVTKSSYYLLCPSVGLCGRFFIPFSILLPLPFLTLILHIWIWMRLIAFKRTMVLDDGCFCSLNSRSGTASPYQITVTNTLQEYIRLVSSRSQKTKTAVIFGV